MKQYAGYLKLYFRPFVFVQVMQKAAEET